MINEQKLITKKEIRNIYRFKKMYLFQVFFYYANYKSGNVGKEKASWLTRKELTEILPERYIKSVQDFLIDETY